ncbi:MAG: hypothetical protein MHM6MM_009097, partial [Cercozoa sp. M6MM]
MTQKDDLTKARRVGGRRLSLPSARRRKLSSTKRSSSKKVSIQQSHVLPTQESKSHVESRYTEAHLKADKKHNVAGVSFNIQQPNRNGSQRYGH